jgi:hypothetical protein
MQADVNAAKLNQVGTGLKKRPGLSNTSPHSWIETTNKKDSVFGRGHR